MNTILSTHESYKFKVLINYCMASKKYSLMFKTKPEEGWKTCNINKARASTILFNIHAYDKATSGGLSMSPRYIKSHIESLTLFTYNSRKSKHV